MSGQITFEVYVQQGTRWEIHSRYNAMQKDDALQEAKSLEAMPSVDATKVIKEVYDPREGLAEEFTIYKSEALQRKASREIASARTSAPAIHRISSSSPAIRESAAPRAVSAPRRQSGQRRRKKPKRSSSVVTVLVKILLIILLGVSVATLLTVLGATKLPYSNVLGVSLTGSSRQNVLIGVFLGSFILTVILSTKSFLSEADFATSRRTQRRPAPPPKARPARPPKNVSYLDNALPPPDTESKDDKEDAADKDDAAEDTKANSGDEMMSPAAAEQKRTMMKFLGDSLKNAKSAQKLDNYNKFGVNLYLAGACEALAKKRGLNEDDEAAVLTEGVQVLGFNRQSAAGFAQKKEEYLLQDSRYMQMYQTGRNAMNSSLEGDGAAAGQLGKALTEWNKPKAKEESTGPITVMFTDMVGSTALTQTRGDAVAQEVVRAHNRIVRDALSQFNGREIKHTGDGIMASFDSTSNSVEAAIAIQRGAQNHCTAHPDLPLKLKIGINAGEPIKEDDDLFGTTVQLSARITDKANAGEIFVSEIVRGICAGKSIQFRTVGDYDMKGFADPITLYEALWEETAVAPADAIPAQAAE